MSTKQTKEKRRGPDVADVAAALGYVEDTWGVWLQFTVSLPAVPLQHHLVVHCDVGAREHRDELNHPPPVVRHVYETDAQALTHAMHALIYEWEYRLKIHLAAVHEPPAEE